MADFTRQMIEEMLQDTIDAYQHFCDKGKPFEEGKDLAVLEILKATEEWLSTCGTCGGSGGGDPPMQCTRCMGSGAVDPDW